MPELPEVETLKRALAPAVVGKTIAAVWRSKLALRLNLSPAEATSLGGWQVAEVARRGKNILWRLVREGKEKWLLIHLGMSGRVHWALPNIKREPHVHWQMHFADEEMVLRYHDPRRFGGWQLWHSLAEIEARLALGLEPLPEILSPSIQALAGKQSTINAAWLFQHTRTSRQPIKVWLMNGKNLAGVGNIYASEALFLAHVLPTTQANQLTLKACARVVDGVQTILRRAINAGGSTLRDYRQVSGESGYFQFDFAVYDRAGEPCLICAVKRKKNPPLIQHLLQAGRSTYFCPSCQK